MLERIIYYITQDNIGNFNDQSVSTPARIVLGVMFMCIMMHHAIFYVCCAVLYEVSSVGTYYLLHDFKEQRKTKAILTFFMSTCIQDIDLFYRV